MKGLRELPVVPLNLHKDGKAFKLFSLFRKRLIGFLV
jgi:hypothetical protein